MSKIKVGLLALVALVVGVLLALTISNEPVDETRYISLYPEPRALPDFVLMDHDGQALQAEDFQQQWTLVFVGYTFCPDICPTTMAELTSIYPALQQLSSTYPIRVMFISVDPARDTTERLAEYVNFFHPKFIAASGEHAQLFPLVRAMGMMYSMSESTDNPNYLVDHSSSVVLLNPDGNVMGRFKPDFVAGKLAISDGQKILQDLPLLISTWP
ncbi:MAG: protein SCO1/2 [Paraglaciecola sp.]|jgi:protein SCO1/2